MHTPAKFNHQQLAQRNGLNGSASWVAYKGKIYDVSASPLFKNGKHYRHPLGCDLTDAMPDAPHLDDVFDGFPVVGLLE